MKSPGKKINKEMMMKHLNMIPKKRKNQRKKAQMKLKNHLKRLMLRNKLIQQQMRKSLLRRPNKKNQKSLETQVKDMNGLVMLTVKEITYGVWKVKIMNGIIKKIKKPMSVESLSSEIVSILLKQIIARLVSKQKWPVTECNS